MQSKAVRVTSLIMATLVALIVGLVPAAPAAAGTNGQQLTIRASNRNSQGLELPGYAELTVSGNNQNNRRSTWTWRSGQSFEVATSNWWWKGTVTVQARFANGSAKTCSTNVPAVQSSNFWTVSCSSDVPNKPPAPATPSNARLGNVTQNSMTLYWNDNSSNEQGFKIERRNGGGWSQIATVGANTTSYASGGLNAGTQYCFRVRAYNTGGDSNYSNETCATTLTPSPSSPSNARLGNVTTNSVALYWNDNSNNEQGFKIERRNGGGWSQIATVGANSTSYGNSGLSAGTQYCFRVRAYNSGGDSGYSNESCATTNNPPPPPPNAPSNARLVNVTTNSVTVQWADNSNNEQGFKVERRNGGGWLQVATVGANSTSYTSSGLSAGTQYCFRVRAYNNTGDSGYSNEPCVTTGNPPPSSPISYRVDGGTHIIRINLRDSRVSFRTAIANNDNGGREYVQSMANRYGAKLAINADYFDFGQDNNNYWSFPWPQGMTWINGIDRTYRCQDHPSNCSYWSADRWRSSVAISRDNRADIARDQARRNSSNNYNVVSGGPQFIKDGQYVWNVVNRGQFPNGDCTINDEPFPRNQQVDNCNYYTNTRMNWTSVGLTQDGNTMIIIVGSNMLPGDMSNRMKAEGAYNALKMDGGTSSTLYYDGSVRLGGVRAVADALLLFVR